MALPGAAASRLVNAAVWPPAAAMWAGVHSELSLAAPLSGAAASRLANTAVWPPAAAACSALRPCLSTTAALLGATSSSHSTTAVCPAAAASCKAVVTGQGSRSHDGLDQLSAAVTAEGSPSSVSSSCTSCKWPRPAAAQSSAWPGEVRGFETDWLSAGTKGSTGVNVSAPCLAALLLPAMHHQCIIQPAWLLLTALRLYCSSTAVQLLHKLMQGDALPLRPWNCTQAELQASRPAQVRGGECSYRVGHQVGRSRASSTPTCRSSFACRSPHPARRASCARRASLCSWAESSGRPADSEWCTAEQVDMGKWSWAPCSFRVAIADDCRGARSQPYTLHHSSPANTSSTNAAASAECSGCTL